MPPKRRVATRGRSALSEEAEQAGQSEVQELRAQVAQMTEALRRQEVAARRQEENMERMMRMLEQRAPPVAPPSVLPVTTSSTSSQISPLTETEQRELMDRLSFIRKFHPPRFSGESSEPWEVENWIAAMEKLFEDLFFKDEHQVHLGAHFLEKDAETWWRRVRPVGPPGVQLMTWPEFRALLCGAFFLIVQAEARRGASTIAAG